MSGYVGFLPPPTYFLHIRCDQHVVSQVAYFGSMWVGVRILHIHSFFRKCFYSCFCVKLVSMLNVHCAALGLVYTHNTHFCMCPTVPTHSNNWSHGPTAIKPLANSQSLGYMYIAVFVDVTIQELFTLSSQLAVFTLKLGVTQT